MGEHVGNEGNRAMKAPPWLLAAPGSLEPGLVVLDPAEARHLTGSLRRRPGDEITLVDGKGSVAQARVESISRGQVEVQVVSVRRTPEPEPDGVTVALAIVDNRAMDWAVQKTVEIGVSRFAPVMTERTQVRGIDIGGRSDHWRRIAMQALKQCRRPWAMDVADVVRLPDLVEGWSGDGVVADRNGCRVGELPAAIENLLVVGPEGGFTVDEERLFDRRGWRRLRLGPHVLRAETAAVVGGALMVMRSQNP
jgi:16S rRNA (uracil1498-N3)-methyltransferase